MVTGQASPVLYPEFGDCQVTVGAGTTTLRAELPDQAALSGADAVVRAYQRATASGTQLRLVVTAQIVRRLLNITGLDRLISIYPSLEAATIAGGAA